MPQDDESFHAKASPSFSPPPSSLYSLNSDINAQEANAATANAAQNIATKTSATQTNATTRSIRTQTYTLEVGEGEGRQDRLRMEILELDVEFLKRRNSKLEERIDDLMNTIGVMQRRMSNR